MARRSHAYMLESANRVFVFMVLISVFEGKKRRDLVASTSISRTNWLFRLVVRLAQDAAFMTLTISHHKLLSAAISGAVVVS